MTRLSLTLAVWLALQSVALAAAPASAPAAPDPAANPVLASLQKMGAKMYDLGNRFGMEGWFIIKNGQVQIAYATADNKGAVIGAMFGQNGENITELQVGTLVQNNKEVADAITAAQKEQAAIAQVGSPPSAVAAAQQPSGAIPSTPLSPGERLMHDLSVASTVVVGNASAPELMMIMDPQCPHCQATWKILRDSVIKGALHVRLIPIANPNGDDERAAAVLLGVADPLNAWDKYVSGDKTALAGTPPDLAVSAVRANHNVTDNWSIQRTPYLVYRAKDGKVKVLLGEPEKVAAVLADLGAQ